LIRHASRGSAAAAILPLPVAMVVSSFWALLVAAVGAAPLLPTGLGLTDQAAIALAAITVGTDPEHRVAVAADSLSENNLAMNHHPRCQVGLDNGDRSWQGRIIF
jgi:hypothetical protein